MILAIVLIIMTSAMGQEAVEYKRSYATSCRSLFDQEVYFISHFSRVKKTEKFLKTSIEVLELSTRAYNAIKVKTVAELVKLTSVEIMGASGVGLRTIDEIEDVLIEYGLWLGMSDEALNGAIARSPFLPGRELGAFLSLPTNTIDDVGAFNRFRTIREIVELDPQQIMMDPELLKDASLMRRALEKEGLYLQGRLFEQSGVL